jgi:hypothetical protein
LTRPGDRYFVHSKPRWVDHYYVQSRDGHRDYVSEPYQLDVDDLEHLLKLNREGWDVYITAAGARWFPGHTLKIELSREEVARG